ncbi:hypothetical protein PGT21_017532 [Puccinia graminis f. sp. tritici]|uniref:Uncharacterized protein n=1 Tax=Puccinia graminis f. sp. tritici TaxID=56615 RepID=A0A5B0LWX1_PUCGR|nr:hypothetical protein PGT21_017532 [Puccinia graminis f. sp. tritici]KAA1068320.1 hypothetical protein PGTUg99_033649 [Puccinia graminis f. sp. tritici]
MNNINHHSTAPETLDSPPCNSSLNHEPQTSFNSTNRQQTSSNDTNYSTSDPDGVYTTEPQIILIIPGLMMNTSHHHQVIPIQNPPKVINNDLCHAACYFLHLASKAGGLPFKLTSDYGTKIIGMAELQMHLSQTYAGITTKEAVDCKNFTKSKN